MEPTATELEDVDDARDWDGFARRRWAHGYALSFALLFGPSVALAYLGIDITRHGRGQDVANLVIGVFVLITVTVGLMLARALAWRLDAKRRWVALGVMLALGAVILVAAWTLFRSRQLAG